MVNRQTRSEKDFYQSCMGSKYRVLDVAIRNNAAYMAVRHEEGKWDGYVFGVVSTFTWYPKQAGDLNFLYRLTEENSGPREDYCPERILKRLSETDNQNALDWRERCRARRKAVA